MKTIIRTFLFVSLSLYATQYAIGAFSYSDKEIEFLSILALSILYFFLKPIVTIVSIPTKGSVFFLVSFISTGIVFYALVNILPDLIFVPVTLRSLNILGIVLPSKDLNTLWAMIFSAFTTSAVYLFLESLCRKK